MDEAAASLASFPKTAASQQHLSMAGECDKVASGNEVPCPQS
jgi:hypothetical protein